MESRSSPDRADFAPNRRIPAGRGDGADRRGSRVGHWLPFSCALMLLTLGASGCGTARSDSGVEEQRHRSRVNQGYFGYPFADLRQARRDSFSRGFRIFNRRWSRDDGLGPRANARSCMKCHHVPVPGGSGVTERAFLRIRIDDGGRAVRVRRFRVDSGNRLQPRQIEGRHVVRKPPALFGLAALSSVPPGRVAAFADPEDDDADGISGRAAQMPGGIGRFGWKASRVSLLEMVADALHNELSVTSPLAGDRTHARAEASLEELRTLTSFVRFLAPPPTEPLDAVERRGRRTFMKAGCGKCHRPDLRAPDGSMGPVQPYTDLLLHDMGPDLAEAEEGAATAGEWRTAPLWGLESTGPPYLHDGRAESVDEAIRAHGGEARRSAGAYERLSSGQKDALVAFLESLPHRPLRASPR